MSNDIVIAGRGGAVSVPVASLPAMVERARQALALAVTPAELLEVAAMAGFAYEAHRASSRAAGRLGLAKESYDTMMAEIYRSQANALEIEAEAKRRFADAYDLAQSNGEVGKVGDNFGNQNTRDRCISEGKTPTQKDIGVTSIDVYRARKIRDIEAAHPGITGEVAQSLVDSGLEPTKAEVSRVINARLGAYSGDNEWYTPARYVDLARSVMGTIDVDPASNDHAQKTVRAARYYTVDNSGLDKDWHGKVWMNPPYSNPEVQQFTEKVAEEYLAGRVTEAIILTNNAGDTAWHHALAEASSAMCITRGRIRFESPTRAGNSPAMGQSFFYLGPNVAHFASLFGEIGRITTNYPVAVARALPGNDNASLSAAA